MLGKDKDVYKGRLSCKDGDLLAHEATLIDTVELPVFDEMGNAVTDDQTGEQLVVSKQIWKLGKNHGRRVAHDVEGNRYVFLADDEPSHNEQHGKGVMKEIHGTSGPLFDEHGKQKFAGDPHHVHPMPDDPHYAADGGYLDRNDNPTYTRSLSDPDSVAEKITGHTEAYTNA